MAELIVSRPGKPRAGRGSGYLINPGQVLTAAHVITGATAIQIRLNPDREDQHEPVALTWTTLPDTDLAIISIDPATTGLHDPSPVAWGTISDTALAVLSAVTVGYPFHKLRTDPDGSRYRDSDHTTGRIPTLANRRQGTLAVYLDQPPPAPIPTPDGEKPVSPWQGMSGAAVWVHGHLVGVVREHHVAEGTGRLSIERIPPTLATLLHPTDDTGDGSELPLVEVVPPDPSTTIRAAYHRQLVAAAPKDLKDRERELDGLTEFAAAGPDQPYLRIEASYRHGKTGLMSWFATHAPAGIDTVAFLITARQAGQADTNAFLTATIDQLNTLTPHHLAEPADTARKGHFHQLLDTAADHLAQLGRRLVLVIDGLDEDTAGATPGWGQSSIASQLPADPHPNLKIIVSSRPNPGLPDDLDRGHDHPLHHCPIQALTQSAEARRLGEEADAELRHVFRTDDIGLQVVGYLTAARGGLTPPDLAHLTQQPPYKINDFLTSSAARCLESRPSGDPDQPGTDRSTHTWQLAHETLQEAAETRLGTALQTYRNHIHEWIQDYADRDWPADAPYYAVDAYPELLRETGDTKRLYTLTTDTHRHQWLHTTTGTDHTARGQLLTVQKLIAQEQSGDLTHLLLLAVHHHLLQLRGYHVPAYLPALWAKLGRVHHGTELARTITDHTWQNRALAGVAAAIAAADPDHAMSITNSITSPEWQASALARVAGVIAASDLDRALSIASNIIDTEAQAWALLNTAQAISEREPHRTAALAAEAEDMARYITDIDARATLIAQIAEVVASSNPDRAEELARSIEDLDACHEAMASVARVIASTNPDRAEKLARSIFDDVDACSWALAGVAEVVVESNPQRAEKLAREVEQRIRAMPNLSNRVEMLTQVVGVFARTDPARAERLILEAEQADPTDIDSQVRTVTGIAAAIAQVAPDRAEDLARRVAYPDHRARILTDVAEVIAEADPARAEVLAREVEELARSIFDADQWADTLAIVGESVAQSDPDRAEKLMLRIKDPVQRDGALTRVILTVLRDDADRAADLVRSITDTNRQEWVLARLAVAIATRSPSRAEELVRKIEHPGRQHAAWARIAGTPTNPSISTDLHVGDVRTESGRVEELLADPYERVAKLTDTAVAIAINHPDEADRLLQEAEHLARSITYLERQAKALTKIAGALATMKPNQAVQLVRSIRPSWQRAEATAWIAYLMLAKTAPGRTTDTRQIEGLLTTSLTEGAWLAAVRAVALTSPSAVQQAADLLLQLEVGQLSRHRSSHFLLQSD